MQQLVDLKRLGDEIPRAMFDRVDRVLHGPVARDDDGDDVRIPLDRRLDDGGAVHTRQPQVGDDDVEGEVGQPFDGFFTRTSLFDVVAAIGQLFGNRLAERRLVFDKQQMLFGVRHV